MNRLQKSSILRKWKIAFGMILQKSDFNIQLNSKTDGLIIWEKYFQTDMYA